MDKIEELKKIYLADDVDSDDYEENLQELTKWESDLIENENMASWLSHDVTKDIMQKAKDAYKDHALELAQGRTLTDLQRSILWAKQDACLWVLSLASRDIKECQRVIREINNNIRLAIARV